MTDEFDHYGEDIAALVEEAISCAPEGWNEGWLTIDCDGSYMNYALKNEGAGNKAQISGELRQLCEELYVVMRESGDWWVKAVLHFFRKKDSWSFEIDFSYQDSPVDKAGLGEDPAPAAESKSRWKFWH